jgi:hypothetical protein
MFTCTDQEKELREADRSPWVGLDRCMACTMRRAGMQQALESRSVIETPGRWATAQRMDPYPCRWLCLHLHRTSEEPEECLAGRFSE